MCPEVSGSVWEGTGRVPELPGARFRFRPNFGYEEGPGGRRLLRLETEEGLRGRSCRRDRWRPFFAAGATTAASFFSGTVFYAATGACIALPLQETMLGTALLPSAALVPMPCFQSCHSGSQQVRLLRVLMPQEGSYMMDEICYLVILRNKYAVAVNTGSCRLDANYALLDSRC